MYLFLFLLAVALRGANSNFLASIVFLSIREREREIWLHEKQVGSEYILYLQYIIKGGDRIRGTFVPPSCTLLQLNSPQWCQRYLLLLSELVILYLLVWRRGFLDIIICDSQNGRCQSLTTAPQMYINFTSLTLEQNL